MPSRVRDLLRLLSLALAAVAVALLPLPAQASPKADAEAAIAGATATVERLRADANFKRDMDPFLARARAVLIVPSFYKGAFFIGGSYGKGVLAVRDDSGRFSAPAFFRLMGGSLGLQFGGQEARMIFMIMTDAGLEAILQDKFKIGAGAGVSFATFGANIEGATTSATGADIVAFAHSAGAFGGGAFEGTVIETRADWNEGIYGPGASPRGILFDRRYPPPAVADSLYHALTVNTGAPADGRQPGMEPAVEPSPMAQEPDLPPVTVEPVQSQPLAPPPATGQPQPQYQPQSQPAPEPAPRRTGGPLLIAPIDSAPLPPAR